MKHFRRGISVIVGLCMALTATLTIVRAAGNARTAPQISPLFTTPERRPCPSDCLLGIVPGKTTLQQAQTLLATHPLTRGYKQSERTNFNGTTGRVALQYLGDGPTIYLLGFLGGGVQSIGVYFYGPGHVGSSLYTLRVGDLMLAYAQRPVIELGFDGLMLNFGLLATAAIPVGGRWDSTTRGFDPNTPIQVISMYEPDYKRYSSLRYSMFSAWQGFASVRHYWRDIRDRE